MEFNEKLQYLRKQMNITQQELADSIYVSRTAVSKWESGRGFPSIDSLKVIADFFSVSVDELLSTDEAIKLAAHNQKETESRYRDLVFGLLDLCMALLLFLPFFAIRADGTVNEGSIFTLCGIPVYIKTIFLTVIFLVLLNGILTLVLGYLKCFKWRKINALISFSLSIAAVIVFIVCLQPYAAVFAFSLLIIKTFVSFKR